MSIKLSDAIETTINVVDWEAMGTYLAEQNSNDQAFLLVGFWAAVSDLQIPLIADSGVFGRASESTRAEVAEFYRGLADAIEKGGKS